MVFVEVPSQKQLLSSRFNSQDACSPFSSAEADAARGFDMVPTFSHHAFLSIPVLPDFKITFHDFYDL